MIQITFLIRSPMSVKPNNKMGKEKTEPFKCTLCGHVHSLARFDVLRKSLSLSSSYDDPL